MAAIPTFLTDRKKIPKEILERLTNLSDEALIKATRQLDFWSHEELSEDEWKSTIQRIVVSEASIRNDNETIVQVPKVRFGRTELQMPMLTCGSMRFQYSWLPSHLPLIANNEKVVLKSASQSNLHDMVRLCFRHGLTHFETARFYGTSELQLVTVLYEMLQSGEIQRDDFIFQTKVPACGTKEAFAKLWNASWDICSKLGHIDLFSLHCVSSPEQVAWAQSDEGSYGFVKKLQEEGKIRHIGFSTHGYASGIMELIESGKFSYVNLHYHFIGSYHASGTGDSKGGQGNLACVQRAKELDMGVFIISPLDKGGKVYKPSKKFCRLLGPEISPISFVLLHVLHTAGAHTATIGFSRLVDFDDVLAAVKLYQDGGFEKTLKAAEDRLTNAAAKELGADWYKKGLLGLPHPYESSTKLLGLGHMLWLHNICSAWGLHEFAQDRYANMLKCKYNPKKTFQENAKAMPSTNMGRGYDGSVNLTEAFSNHFDADAARSKLEQVHEWLTNKPLRDEWGPAYDLQTWPEFANTSANLAGTWRLLLDSLTFGLFKSSGGPNKETRELAQQIREILK